MLKFTAIGDFHYKKGSYPNTVDDLEKIIEDAHNENVDFILHLGDFCNDYKGSPELMSAFLNNKYNIPVYGVMGNHEIETNVCPDDVIPFLSNREITFGEPIYNEKKAAHWYTDLGKFRLIGLDTNFVYSEANDEWIRKMQFRRPEGTTLDTSLAPLQMEWLDKILADAASLGKKVIVASHACFIGEPWLFGSPDMDAVREIFAKYPKTVLMAINGHIHTDNFDVRDGVAYYDVNSARFGYWRPDKEHHYSDEHTYLFTDYDENGNKLGTIEKSYCTLRMGSEGWFFKEPLWSTVTLTEDGHVTIKGRKSEWEYGIAPEPLGDWILHPKHFAPVILDRDAQVW